MRGRGKPTRTLGNRSQNRKKEQPAENPEETVELEEICTRLNRIIERSNGIDAQLAEIEKKKKGRVSITEITPAAKKKIPSPVQPIRKSTQMAKEKKRTTFEQQDFDFNLEPLQPTPRRKPASPEKKEITMEDIYYELIALRKEVAGIVQTQNEMKRDIAGLYENRYRRSP